MAYSPCPGGIFRGLENIQTIIVLIQTNITEKQWLYTDPHQRRPNGEPTILPSPRCNNVPTMQARRKSEIDRQGLGYSSQKGDKKHMTLRNQVDSTTHTKLMRIPPSLYRLNRENALLHLLGKEVRSPTSCNRAVSEKGNQNRGLKKGPEAHNLISKI